MLCEHVCRLWSGLVAQSASGSPGLRPWKRQVPVEEEQTRKRRKETRTGHLPGRMGVRPVV